MSDSPGKPSQRQSLGRWGETLAARVLHARGYDIIERNWRCQAGEIDLVAKDQHIWVFVEVRTRRSKAFGPPEESVTPKKRKKLIEVATTYLHEGGLNDVEWRIDVVAIQVGRDGGVLRVNVIPNAVQVW